MSTYRTADLCEGKVVKRTRHGWPGRLFASCLAVAALFAATEEPGRLVAANAPAPTPIPGASAPAKPAPASPERTSSSSRRSNSGSSRLDESAFRIVSERNIFNANRSGGQVRISTRRPSRVESFTLVGTIAYPKGVFAFFQGSSSELTKVVKPEGTIAGYKVADVLADGVKLEADGKVTELAVGSAMRREDEGTWHPGDAIGSSSESSSHRDDRDAHPDPRARFSSGGPVPTGGRTESYRQDKQDVKEYKKEIKLDAKEESDILKRLMERRAKESQ